MTQYFTFPGHTFEKDGPLWLAIEWVKDLPPVVIPAPAGWPAGWSGTVTLSVAE